MRVAPLETERPRMRALLVKHALAWGLIAALLVPSPLAASRPVADLLKKLNLSDYPRGDRPPEFSGRTYMGRKVSLADLKGKVILLNFWASWCYECRPEMPVLEKLHREFTKRGLAVLGVNLRESDIAIKNYAADLGLTFPLVTDPNGTIAASYGVIGLPTTFLIGRDGRAVGLAVGPREWDSVQAREILEMLLAEPYSR
jgi:peroxiredoxin